MVNRLGSSLAKVISGTNNLDYLVDKDLTNYVSTVSAVDASVALEPSFSIKDLKHTYAKGTTAGFVIGMSSNSLLNLNLIGLPYQIWFYKDGKRVDRVNCNEKSGSLLNLKLLKVSGDDITCEVTATTTKDDFDEIAICYAGGVKADVLSNSKIYYAFVGKNGRYFLSNETPGLAELKAKYNNNNLTLTHDGQWGDNLLDNDSKNRYILTNSEKTVMLYDNNITKLDDQFFFPKDCKVGFEYTGSLLDIAKVVKLKLWQYCPTGSTWIGGIKYDGQWKDVTPENTTDFNLLGVNLGLERQSSFLTAPQPFNAVEILSGGLTAVNLIHAFVELPPSIDEDSPLTVSANRSLCDEKQTVTLHSDEAVTWECTKTPEGAKQPTLTNADKGLSCTVSGFVNEGDYEFTAKTKDGRTATTTVTYGIRPIINTAIHPWVNNFTEKGVSYSANADQYKKWYKLTSLALIPEIVTDTANLVTPSLDDYAKAGGISLASKKMLSCVFRSQTYQSDEKVTVGFVARTKWKALNLNLLNGLKVKVYNAGAVVDEESSENVHFKVLSADAINGQNYVTTEYSVEIDANHPFDAITLWDNGLLSANLSEMDVYYAFVEPSVLAQKYKDNVSTTWQTISHSKTGASIDASKLSTFGVAKVADAVENLTNIIDDDNTNYATLAGLATVGAGNSVAVKLGRKFEGGHQVKFIVSNEDWLKVDLGSFITLKAYLNGDEKATKTNWDVLSLNVIGGENKEAEILWTPTDGNNKPVDFDEISISFNGVANVADVAWIYGIQVANDADGDGIIDANDDESCPNEAFLLDENEPKLDKIHDFANTKMYLHRTFAPGKWTTICLPVDITFNQFAAIFGNDAELAKPKDFRADTPNRVQFDIIENVYGNNVLLQKNKPYIIKVNSLSNGNKTIDPKFAADNATTGTLAEEKENNLALLNSKLNTSTKAQEGSCYLFKGISYNTTEENNKSNIDPIPFDHNTNAVWPMTQITWHGTFVCPQHIDKDFYSFRLQPQDANADAEMDHVTEAIESFRGLRCWMTANGTIVKGVGAKQLTLAVGDQLISSRTTTGISDVKSHTLSAGNIYTLTGVLVRRSATSTDGLGKGIYIWNNKKIEVK